jgi:hypothetical protein
MFSVQYVRREEIIIYTAVSMYGDSGEFMTGSAWLLCRHVANVLHTSHFFTQSYRRATIFSQFCSGTGHTSAKICRESLPHNFYRIVYSTPFSWSTQYSVFF